MSESPFDFGLINHIICKIPIPKQWDSSNIIDFNHSKEPDDHYDFSLHFVYIPAIKVQFFYIVRHHAHAVHWQWDTPWHRRPLRSSQPKRHIRADISNFHQFAKFCLHKMISMRLLLKHKVFWMLLFPKSKNQRSFSPKTNHDNETHNRFSLKIDRVLGQCS